MRKLDLQPSTLFSIEEVNVTTFKTNGNTVDCEGVFILL